MSGANAKVQSLGGFVWSIAEILRGDFKQSEYGKVILPFVVLRRLDCILEASKADVLEAAKGLPEGVDDETRDTLRYEGDGVLIQEVMPSSPAARQGLRAGDIILKVGSAPVSTPQDVVGEVKKLKPAKRPVLLLVQREGNQRYVALKVG